MASIEAFKVRLNASNTQGYISLANQETLLDYIEAKAITAGFTVTDMPLSGDILNANAVRATRFIFNPEGNTDKRKMAKYGILVVNDNSASSDMYVFTWDSDNFSYAISTELGAVFPTYVEGMSNWAQLYSFYVNNVGVEITCILNGIDGTISFISHNADNSNSLHNGKFKSVAHLTPFELPVEEKLRGGDLPYPQYGVFYCSDESSRNPLVMVGWGFSEQDNVYSLEGMGGFTLSSLASIYRNSLWGLNSLPNGSWLGNLPKMLVEYKCNPERITTYPLKIPNLLTGVQYTGWVNGSMIGDYKVFTDKTADVSAPSAVFAVRVPETITDLGNIGTVFVNT